MFLISTFLEKEAYIATAAAIAIMVDVSRISMYVYRGAFQVSHAMWIIPLVIVACMGVFTGRRLHNKQRSNIYSCLQCANGSCYRQVQFGANRDARVCNTGKYL